MIRCGTRAWAGLPVLACAAGAWAGEEPSVTWLWEVTTDDGDALVEPGETASITLSADMEPSVGEPGQTDGFIVVGLAATIFDTLGGLNADRGGIVGWEVLNMLTFPTGDLTTTDGVSLFNTHAGQGPTFNVIFTTDDPVDVLTFSWSTDDFSGYTAHYQTHTSVFAIGESEGDLNFDNTFAVTDILEAQVQFQVAPSPPVSAAVLLAMLAVRRRRRPF